nr:hypothetical protein [Tanacetum cinerariifolium]
MANPLPNHGVNLPNDEQVQPKLIPALHGFAPAVLDIPNNNNEWIEEEPKEDLEMEEEEEEEEEEMDIEEEIDDPEIIDPYEIEEGELPPPPADSDTSSDSEPEVEAEDEDGDEATVITITREPYSVQPFSGTIYMGSGSSRKMFDRANTEYSTLKRLGEMDRFMPPKAMSQAAIERLITQRVNVALEAERAGRVNKGGKEATPFHCKEGAIELCRRFEKFEMVFSISDCAERNKVKFAATTLQGRALTCGIPKWPH